MYLDSVFHFSNQLVTRFKQGARLVPVIWHKPRVVKHWLMHARGAHMALLVLILGVPFVLIPISLLEFIFSPVTEETVFGLFRTTRDNPYLGTMQTLSHWLVWIAALFTFFYLLVNKLPNTVDHARHLVVEIMTRADRLLELKPAESVLLYNQAAEWNLDEDTQTVLTDKLQTLSGAMPGGSVPGDSVFEQLDETLIANPQTSTSDAIDTLIAERYLVKKILGSGAMGNVYLAEDTRLKREVALKQLAPGLSTDEHLLARFRQEAVALARLSHPHIVQVYDFLEAEGFFWIAMELVKGGELEVSNMHDMDEVIRLVKQMAEALGYAHEKGVVHRDFKPANVLLTEHGDIKISDFGIAKLAQSSIHTQMNTVMGTPSYMSPEQANGDEADLRTDIYSLGIVLYQMLSGSLPFDGDTRSIIAQHLTKAPPSLCENHKHIPEALDRVVQTMLAKDPAERYTSMKEVIDAL